MGTKVYDKLEERLVVHTNSSRSLMDNLVHLFARRKQVDDQVLISLDYLATRMQDSFKQGKEYWVSGSAEQQRDERPQDLLIHLEISQPAAR